MGDRSNPIKFGPEWLRNLAREPTTGANASPVRDTRGVGTEPARGGLRPAAPNQTSTPNAPKVQLARLSYGREEMLALYDRQTAEAPSQLKSNDILYQPRGKVPYALNNSFDEDTRDSTNRPTTHASGASGLSVAERFWGAGRGRGMSWNEPNSLKLLLFTPIKGKARGYNRPTSAGRVWHGNRVGGTLSGNPEDDPNQPLRPWSNNNQQTLPGLRPNNGEQQEPQTKQAQYRPKRQTSTNWRQQPGRDEGEEWRSSDGSRRPQDKWEWGWQQEASPKQAHDKQWHSNRRTWTGGEASEDTLPEWAVDNAEACGGTFDSSGAFHGYSNDDSNLPKNQENSYPLTKSHTHGSFSRPKIAEEETEEWWASEKAKKLSPKRFDASEIQFKKLPSTRNAEERSNSNTATTNATTDNSGPKNTGAIRKSVYQTLATARKLRDELAKSRGTSDETSEAASNVTPTTEAAQKDTDFNIPEKPFETHPEIDKNKEKGVQSVILTSNNTLRQKHQNIAVTPTETPKRQPSFTEYLDTSSQHRQIESITSEQFGARKDTESNKIVEDILQMNLDDGIPSATINQLLTNNNNMPMNSLAQVPYQSIQMRTASALQGLRLNSPNMQNTPLSARMQTTERYEGMMQPIGMPNSMLNASLGLPMPGQNSALPHGMSPSLSNPGMTNQNTLGLQNMGGGNLQQSAIQAANMQPGSMQSGQVSGLHMQGRQGFGVQPGALSQNQIGGMQNINMAPSGTAGGLPPGHNAMPAVGNSAIFNNQVMPNQYNNLINTPTLDHIKQLASDHFRTVILGEVATKLQKALSEQWYYEDPNHTIQGPFCTEEMYLWHRAGFFNPSLMVRRGCDTVMRPLGTYGHAPFKVDLPLSLALAGGYDAQARQTMDNIINPQPALGVDVQSLWGQPKNNVPVQDDLWMPTVNSNYPQNVDPRDHPLYFWNNQASELPANPMLPDTIKTEEEILAQMRAAQVQGPTSPLSFFADSPVVAPEVETNTSTCLDINQLQKLIQKDAVPKAIAAEDTNYDQQVSEKPSKDAGEAVKKNKTVDKPAEVKPAKEVAKVDNSKQKGKESSSKPKSKKEKAKEETLEVKLKEEENKLEKRSAEPSPSPKPKKEDKSSKKELDKEKKEWIKEGFTIVKGAEKAKDKESKKKAEEVKAADEAERKRKEDEKLAAEEKKRQTETAKKQPESLSQQTSSVSRQAAESVSKKAPWSATTQALPKARDGPTLAEIQRLEREKKLEQMKEQQQMMQIIAQQQAAALAREQEVQTVLGWAKKPNTVPPSPTMAEIQAETRKQAAAAAVASATVAPLEESQPATPPPANTTPWATLNNGEGFWDTPPTTEPVKLIPKIAETKAETKNKKKATVMASPKQETTPSVEFEMWCSNMLVSWRDTGIDVPTFVSFLKDIESPYEVKDYVKCYLGDTRESSDFARQFLEKRSRLLRVGMVTPSDDLCSPAVAVNPRANSGSDHADLKAKGKKTKKNKMLKVDARNILGFSVTASEDRINVGDIDTV